MMHDAIVVHNLGKMFRKEDGHRPKTLKEALLKGLVSSAPKKFWGLRNVNFTVPKGRTMGVVGENGAGKSTLLRLIGGVGRPDEGYVRVNGRIGALLDLGAGLTGDLTGRENIFVAGVISGMSRSEIRQRYEAIVAFAELEDFIDSPIRTYSMGMRMRLAFSVAAHISPDVLLIDEVLAVGDLRFQRKCLERISAIKATGCTIFIVSHVSSEIHAFCDDVLFLKRGRMVACGPVDEVMSAYEADVLGQAPVESADLVLPKVLPDGKALTLGVNRLGSQELEAIGVRLLNSEGNPTRSLLSGASLTVEIDFKARRMVAAPKASVEISDRNGVVCFDTNTDVGGLLLESLEGTGTLRLRIERLDLAGGDYSVSIGFYAHEWKSVYDYHANAYPLRVIGMSTGKGSLCPPLRWEANLDEGALAEPEFSSNREAAPGRW